MKEEIEDATLQKEFYSAHNNQLIINNNLLGIDINNKCIDDSNPYGIQLAEYGKERMDHISLDHLMNVLDQKDFTKSMKKLIASIYFHPKAPANYRGWVVDKTAAFGAIEFNPETKSLLRKMTNNVITKNVQCIMFKVTDLLDELQKARKFNQTQAINCERFIQMMGNDIDPEFIAEIKDSAYENRNFPKTLWEHLNYPVETTPMVFQSKIKTLYSDN